jgi:hypothetical protein
MSNKIYVITTVQMKTVFYDPKDESKKGIDGFYRYRFKRTTPRQTEDYRNVDSATVGWFKNLDDAREAIENNYGDMHECSYNYAVIEPTDEGLYGFCGALEDQIWFYWNGVAFVEGPMPVGQENIGGYWL